MAVGLVAGTGLDDVVEGVGDVAGAVAAWVVLAAVDEDGAAEPTEQPPSSEAPTTAVMPMTRGIRRVRCRSRSTVTPQLPVGQACHHGEVAGCETGVLRG